MLGSFNATVSHTVDYVLRHRKNMAAIRFRNKLYLLTQDLATSCRQGEAMQGSWRAESVLEHWPLGHWYPLAYWGGKGILVAPSITLERRHKAALNKVGPGDSSNSGDSAPISIDAAVSLKLSKVFSALAHFSTIGPDETLLLKTYSNTFRCCGRWKLKHCRSAGWALFWACMSDKCSPNKEKKIREIRNNYHQTQWYNCLTDRQKHTQKRKDWSRGSNVVNPQLLKCAYLCECVCLAVYHESLVGLH